jgi:ABC-2 type transport system permease protein
MNALRGFLVKEVRHILRDRQTLLILLLLPVAQVLLFGYALRTDVRTIRLAVVDPAPDEATNSLRARFDATGLFRTVRVLPAAAALPALFERGRIDQAIVFEPGFARNLVRGDAQLLVITDATDPNTGSITQAYTATVVRGWQSERSAARVLEYARARSAGLDAAGADAGNGAGAGAPPPAVAVRFDPAVRMRFNPSMESVNLFIPGLIALVLTVVSALMSAIALSREKERGTLEVLLVSPLRPWQIITGKVLPYLLLGFLNLLSVLAAARFVFGVPFRGSILLLLAASLLFIVVSLSLGVLIATVTSSQRTAMIGALMGLMLPTLLLSGMIFPLASMPLPLQWLANVVPAKWFALVARGIMLKGVGLAHLWQELLVLTTMAALLLTAAMRSFRIRLA